jgi:hypothetical protein
MRPSDVYLYSKLMIVLRHDPAGRAASVAASLATNAVADLVPWEEPAGVLFWRSDVAAPARPFPVPAVGSVGQRTRTRTLQNHR